MNKKLLYGALIFILGVAMVACGDKNSGSSATPQQLEPAIPVTAGDLNPSNTGCRSTTCQYTGRVIVTNPEAFVELGATPLFATGDSTGVELSEIRSLSDVWDIFFGSIRIGVEFDGHGNRDTSIGFTGGTITNGQGLAPMPAVNQAYAGSLYFNNSGAILGSYTVPSGAQGFEGFRQVNPQGAGSVFVDTRNKMMLIPIIGNGATTANQFSIHLILDSARSAEAGRFIIDTVY